MNKINHNWNKEIAELEKFFSTATLPKRVRLNSWTLVVDPRLMIDSHLSMIRYHNGESAYTPYIERLFELKKILEDEQKGTGTD
jgi:hypothetical protein